jgi:hypothetical protein
VAENNRFRSSITTIADILRFSTWDEYNFTRRLEPRAPRPLSYGQPFRPVAQRADALA